MIERTDSARHDGMCSPVTLALGGVSQRTVRWKPAWIYNKTPKLASPPPQKDFGTNFMDSTSSPSAFGCVTLNRFLKPCLCLSFPIYKKGMP